jgi:hypothetical protein
MSFLNYIVEYSFVILHHYELSLCQLSAHAIYVFMAYPSNVPIICCVIKFVLLSNLFLFLWQNTWEENDYALHHLQRHDHYYDFYLNVSTCPHY